MSLALAFFVLRRRVQRLGTASSAWLSVLELPAVDLSFPLHYFFVRALHIYFSEVIQLLIARGWCLSYLGYLQGQQRQWLIAISHLNRPPVHHRRLVCQELTDCPSVSWPPHGAFLEGNLQPCNLDCFPCWRPDFPECLWPPSWGGPSPACTCDWLGLLISPPLHNLNKFRDQARDCILYWYLLVWPSLRQ